MAKKPKAPAAPRKSHAASVARGAAVAAGGVAMLGGIIPGAPLVAAGLGVMALSAAKQAWKDKKAALATSPSIVTNFADQDTQRALQGVASKSAGTTADHNEGAPDPRDQSVMNSILNKRVEGRMPAGQSERGMSERIPHMMTPPGYNDQLRGKPKSGEQSGARDTGFQAANAKFEAGAEKMRQSHGDQASPSSSKGNSKKGWQNPKVQAAAQKARGAKYNGPTS